MDIDDSSRTAAEETRLRKEQSTVKCQKAALWNESLNDLKNAQPRDDATIDEAGANVKELTRESRNLAAKAKGIEDVAYDLKAFNPHKKPVADTRTPKELLEIITAKGQEVAEGLAALRMEEVLT